jgi:hypothetical protein
MIEMGLRMWVSSAKERRNNKEKQLNGNAKHKNGQEQKGA